MKHTGAPESTLALPFEMRPRKLAIAGALLVAVGIVLAPLLVLVVQTLLGVWQLVALGALAFLFMVGLAYAMSRLVYLS